MTVTSAAAVAPAPTLLSLLISDWLHDMRVSLFLSCARARVRMLYSFYFVQKNPFFKFLPQKKRTSFLVQRPGATEGSTSTFLYSTAHPAAYLLACACLLPGGLLPEIEIDPQPKALRCSRIGLAWLDAPPPTSLLLPTMLLLLL